MDMDEYIEISRRNTILIILGSFILYFILYKTLQINNNTLMGILYLSLSTTLLVENLTFKKYRNLVQVETKSEKHWFRLKSEVYYPYCYITYIGATCFSLFIIFFLR